MDPMSPGNPFAKNSGMSTLVKVLQKLDIQENRKEANLGIFIEIPQKYYPDKH